MKMASLWVMMMGLAWFMAVGCASVSDRGAGAEATLSDLDVRDAVVDRLREDPVTARQTFGVNVSGGVVTLTGSVRNPQVRMRAISIAEGTPGVTEVVDSIYR